MTDTAWELYLESLDHLGTVAYDGSVSSSFKQASRDRDQYLNWLFRTLEKSQKAGEDTSWLQMEIERLQSSGDDGVDLWGTRPELGDIEYGTINTLPRWSDMGWTVDEEDRNPDAPKDAAEDVFVLNDEWLSQQAQLGPDLHNVEVRRFNEKDAAQKFVDKTRQAYRRGDHSHKITRCWIDKNASEGKYVADVLVADGNWEHRKALSEERNRRVEKALNLIQEATSRQQLDRLAKTCKQYSRDSQVLASGKTFDGGKVIDSFKMKSANFIKKLRVADYIFQATKGRSGQAFPFHWEHTGRRVGIGFDYIRFATLMNAIADRANELGLSGYRRYNINSFDKTRKPANGDILDVGARQGEFLSTELSINPASFAGEEDPMSLPPGESLWSLREGTWKPSEACEAHLKAVGPTGFIPRSWSELRESVDEWMKSPIPLPRAA